MMRRERMMKVWSLVPLAVLAACEGGAERSAGKEAPGQTSQAVLYTPPVPAGGDVAGVTTDLGPVALGGAVRTYFTQDPQYYAFRVTAPGALNARFEVTHEGSAMYLDTGLFVYGPRDASGRYGAWPRAQDDNAGYGDLSRIASVALPAGEYLVVVSSGSGAGQQFQLRTTCLSGACPTPPPPGADANGALPALVEQPLTAQLEATLEAGNDAREWTEGSLRRFDFTWPHAAPPTLAQADRAVLALREYEAFADDDALGLTYPQARGYLYSEFEPLHPQLLAAYGNGSERVQVATRYYSRYVAPGASGWFRLFVVLFPQSRKVIVFQQNGYEI